MCVCVYDGVIFDVFMFAVMMRVVETLCNTLWEKNTYIAIVEGLRHHKEDPSAVCAACRALRGLCIFK